MFSGGIVRDKWHETGWKKCFYHKNSGSKNGMMMYSCTKLLSVIIFVKEIFLWYAVNLHPHRGKILFITNDFLW